MYLINPNLSLLSTTPSISSISIPRHTPPTNPLIHITPPRRPNLHIPHTTPTPRPVRTPPRLFHNVLNSTRLGSPCMISIVFNFHHYSQLIVLSINPSFCWYSPPPVSSSNSDNYKINVPVNNLLTTHPLPVFPLPLSRQPHHACGRMARVVPASWRRSRNAVAYAALGGFDEAHPDILGDG
jgi:hypothetical protein